MTVSNVEICNLALIRLGQPTIQSLDEASKEAKHCAILYDRVRRTVLRDHPWSFAMKTEVLAELSDTEKEDDWDYVYQKPTDCLRVVELVDVAYTSADDVIPFELRGQKVLTNQEEAKAKYVEDITDPNDFDEQFIEALSYRLAMDLSLPLTGRQEYLAPMAQMYLSSKMAAKAGDAREARTVPPERDTFITARA